MDQTLTVRLIPTSRGNLLSLYARPWQQHTHTQKKDPRDTQVNQNREMALSCQTCPKMLHLVGHTWLRRREPSTRTMFPIFESCLCVCAALDDLARKSIPSALVRHQWLCRRACPPDIHKNTITLDSVLWEYFSSTWSRKKRAKSSFAFWGWTQRNKGATFEQHSLCIRRWERKIAGQGVSLKFLFYMKISPVGVIADSKSTLNFSWN